MLGVLHIHYKLLVVKCKGCHHADTHHKGSWKIGHVIIVCLAGLITLAQFVGTLLLKRDFVAVLT